MSCPFMMYLPVFILFMQMSHFSFDSAPLVLSKAQELGKMQRFVLGKKKKGRKLLNNNKILGTHMFIQIHLNLLGTVTF